MIGEIITSIGLVFDIAGAVVITEPIIRRFVKLTDQRGAKISDERDEARMNPDYEYKVTRKAKYGMALLIIGFGLQFVGTIISMWFKS